jgi:hypothetical protein
MFSARNSGPALRVPDFVQGSLSNNLYTNVDCCQETEELERNVSIIL